MTTPHDRCTPFVVHWPDRIELHCPVIRKGGQADVLVYLMPAMDAALVASDLMRGVVSTLNTQSAEDRTTNT